MCILIIMAIFVDVKTKELMHVLSRENLFINVRDKLIPETHLKIENEKKLKSK